MRKTFRARLAFWMAAISLTALLLSGAATYASVRATLLSGLDEALLAITRTELESPIEERHLDPTEINQADESLLAWNTDTGDIFIERGLIPLRSYQHSTPNTQYQFMTIDGRPYRALYYPYADDGKHFTALCVVPITSLEASLRHIALRILGFGLLGAIISCALSWGLAVRLTRPLQTIATFTTGIREVGQQQRLPSPSPDAELVAVTDSLNTMLERLEAAFAAQSRFVADASHELRSPLANLRTTAEVALRRDDPELHERALRLTVLEVERLTRLSENLLTLSLADAGTLLQATGPVDLDLLGREAIEAIRSRAEESGITLEITSDSAAIISGDAMRLRQVFDNLLDNALRHSPSGGTIQLTVRKSPEEISITIADSGEGIPEAEQPFIFDRLWRSDSSRARRTGGFGLGLAIVREIVEAHGGTIIAAPNSPTGTQFLIRFPSGL
ncbi:MAG: ATP-binding protein [Armatimonas sp.]